MTDEEILQALKNDKTIIVNDIWCFTGRIMMCVNGPECCETDYDTLEEALEGIHYYSRFGKTSIRIL